ncbi:GerMN domain-containing protein [Metallumcola ferriviriculae]|uniref:GerMN domain-containing protein n=1 Tax=Metallumcola ferriviriculae TaxID=3039180 RepID=A0AAU0UJZ7_9FIRM|nr:GerMN domain-containing protein [Desulfitibacteraceae bacterium MK1]
MKRLIALVVVILMVSIMLAGCRGQENNNDKGTQNAPQVATNSSQTKELLGETRSAVVVYYQDSSGKYLLPVTMPIEPTDRAANVALEKLLSGPETEQVKPVIPKGTKLRELYLKDNIAFVSLTQEFLSVGSTNEVNKAVKAVVLTLTEFPMVETVQILVDGQVVKDLHGVNLDKALTRPGAVNGPEYKDAVTVYYGNYNASLLVPYSAPIRDDDPIKSALEALLAGPPAEVKEELIPTIWPGTKIRDIRVNGKTLIVDLSQEVIGYGGGSASENMLVDSLVATMIQFEEINEVQLLIEGKAVSTLPEGTDVSAPLKRPINPIFTP